MRLLYFSWVKQKVGRGEEEIALPLSVDTVEKLMRYLSGLDENYRAAFADPSRLRAAVNQVHSGFEARISPEDEIAFFPPVTGG